MVQLDMARQLRIEFPGALYHISNRGDEKKAIFRDSEDKESFLDVLALVIDRFGWLCHAFTLMPNHYHLLLETPKGNLSRGMMQLNSIYTQRFNRRHNRVGHLFQGRFNSILVEKDAYLLSLIRYIVMNPVRAGLVAHPEECRWSSYASIIGVVASPGFLTIDWLLSQFGSERGKAIKAYREFVESSYEAAFPYDELVGNVILGSESFIRKVVGCVDDETRKSLEEIPRKQRQPLPPELDVIFEQGVREGISRNELICNVHYEYDYTISPIR